MLYPFPKHTFIIFAALAFYAVSPHLGFISEVEAAEGPCEKLENLMHENSEKSVVDKLTNVFKALWSRDDSVNDNLYFMNKSGFSLKPKCAGRAKFGAHLYYPMGLVVKKISNSVIKIGNRKLTYTLVEAEYGLRLYVDSAHLQKIEKTKTYLFSNSLSYPPICFGTRTCTEERKLESIKNKVYLHPTGYYAAVGKNLTSCEPSAITLFTPGHKMVNTADHNRQRARIRACDSVSGQENMGWSPNIKVVTIEKYTEIFSQEVDGNYQRFTENILAKIIPGSTNRKLCNEKTIEDMSKRISGGGGIKIPIYVAEISAGASAQKVVQRITTLPEGIYVFYSSYFVSGGKINPIETLFNCDDNKTSGGRNLKPQSLYSLTIHNENVDGGEIIINGPTLMKLMLSLSSKTGKKTDTNNPKLDGIVDASDGGKNIGRYWKIKGYYEYLRLRDAYHTCLGEHTNVNNVVGYPADSALIERNLSYFTHLLLVATTEPHPRKR